MGNIDIIMNNLKEIYEKEECLGKKAFKGRYKEYGISEIHCVDAIGKIEDPNVTKISKYMSMTRGAISKIAKKLLENGIIKKYKKPENEKEIYFRLTKLGEEMYFFHEEKHRNWEERNNKFFQDISENEQKIIINFLQSFNKHLENQIDEEKEVK